MVLEERESKISVSVDPDEEAALLSRFIEGDDTAFAELFDRHNHRLYLYCLKIINNQEQAQDLLQEMWERVIKLRLRPQVITNPVGFFATILRNLCFNQLKMQKRHMALATQIPAHGEYEPPQEASEMEEIVYTSLQKLPLDFKEVLVLNIYSGYEYEEIAAMLGKSVTAIRMRASRARAQLRKIIEDTVGKQHDKSSSESIESFLNQEVEL